MAREKSINRIDGKIISLYPILCEIALAMVSFGRRRRGFTHSCHGTLLSASGTTLDAIPPLKVSILLLIPHEKCIDFE